MPILPNKVKRPWQKEYKPQQRAVDMSWFYNNWRWRMFSKRYKDSHPICKPCEAKGIITPTTVTDHIVRYVDNGPGFNVNNLKDEYFQPMCDACHNSKSGKEAHGFK